VRLTLERKVQPDRTIRVAGGAGMVTPPIGEGYWSLRVQVSKRQAVVAFPKFGTVGIGFEVEEDWNTNLPYTCDAETIYKHIRHNRLDAGRKNCIEAIRMIQAAIA